MSDKKYTLEELEQFDGKDGRPAYFAFDGKVYDATGSRLWRNGTHVRVHHAGKDLTPDLDKAPHGASAVERLPVVGVVSTAVDAAVQEGVIPELPAAPVPPVAVDSADDGLPFFVEMMYKMHSHPASVHFPIALCVVASLLYFVGLVIDCQTCMVVADWNMVLGFVTSPLPLFSGVLDWIYQFGGRPTKLFMAKLILSVVFVVTGGLLLVMNLVTSSEPALIYHLLYLSFAPQVLALGFIGGRITFPS
jgi:predicted heme/steroid binding protein/uncharacterized membrane protein